MRSSGWPILPWGMREIHCFRRSGLSSRIFWVLRIAGQECQRGSWEMYTAASAARETRGNLQGRQHVSRRNAVDPDVCVRPLDGQRRGQVADGCFGRIVGPVDGDCQQLFLDNPPLQNPKRAFPSPAKDFGSLGDEPMRDTTPDQPRASRGPKCCLSPTVPAANCCWSGRWGQRAMANLVSP